MINITLYIILLFVVIATGWLIIFLFDFLLIKGILRLIVWKARKRLDKDKIEEVIHRIMENRHRKWAFKAYISAVTFIIGSGGVFPFLKANLFIANKKGMVNLELLVDNEISPWLIGLALFVVTISYWVYMYLLNEKYKKEILSDAAKVINEQFRFIPTQDWFKEKSELNIRNLGKGFNLNVNFKYELFEDAFVSTCRDERLIQCFSEDKMQLIKEFVTVKDILETELGKQETQEIDKHVRIITDKLSQCEQICFGHVTIEKAIDDIESIFRQAISNKKLNYDDYNYTKIHTVLYRILERIHNPWIQSLKGHTLIVYGKGGYGKTHLLAKLVQRRLEEKLPTLFLLGRLITNTNIPMDQILETLDLKCKKEIFFQALNEYGERHGRVLIVVDGINEGVGLSLWKDHLLNFLNELQPYKNIGLIVSVRTNGGNSWIDHFIRNEKIPSYMHRGFEDNVSGAVEYMFKSFSVPLPMWPVISNEFKNPLLLTLFCRAHQGDKISPKYETRLEIMENYINHFNQRLANIFHYSYSVNILQDVLSMIANRMIDQCSRWRLS